MDLMNVFLLCLMSCLIGAVLMLLLQYVAVVKFFKAPPIETTQEHAINQAFALPESIMCNVKSMDPATKNSMIAFNLIFQFLFYEARFSAPVRNWIYRKLTVELEELIAKTTVSKFFDKFLLRDLDLGTQFPEIRNLRVHNVDLHDTDGHIESLDVVMDLHYKGNFKVAIDGQMLLGKKVFLSIKVKHLSGLARLQFTRRPYSHWSVCFIGDPALDLDIETLFQGRQLQPHLTGLLSNQIRKVVRRKHTLPTYKLRYRPFFAKCADQFARACAASAAPFAHGDPNGCAATSTTHIGGQLEVNISELSRLAVPAHTNHVFCTVTAAPMPWVQVRQLPGRQLAITLEVRIQRAKNQQLGIMFQQRTADTVTVERVLANTPATRANLLAGDRLLAIEERPVTTIAQVSKLIRSLARPEIVFRVERLRPGCIRSDCGCDDAFGEYEDMEADVVYGDAGATDNTDSTTVVTAAMMRKNSADRTSLHSTASSVSNTPSSSPRKPADTGSTTTGSTPTTAASTATITSSMTSMTSMTSTATTTSTTSGTDVASRLARKLSKVTASRSICSDRLMVGEEIVMQTATATAAAAAEEAAATAEQPLLMLQQHTTVNCLVSTQIRLNDLANFELNAECRWLNVCVYGQCNETVQLLGFVNISVAAVLTEYAQTSLWQLVKKLPISPPQPTSMATHQLSSLKGFEPKLCFGDVLLSFVWSGSASDEDLVGKQQSANPEATGTPGTHDFVRTQFNRSTQCEYCGKKIWLKDAVQCGRCNMITHKKCVKKCQIFTVCGAAADCLSAEQLDAVAQPRPIVELRLTESEQSTPMEPADARDRTVDVSCLMTGEQQQQQQQQQQQPAQSKNSFSDFLAQGMKRVNSVNNLAIPGMGAAGAPFTRSLPPSPQHTPRKQSLANQSTNPFAGVVLALEQLSDSVEDLEEEHIVALTQPLIGWGTAEELMGLAKTSSRSLYGDLEPNDCVDKINILLARLRILLDVETTNYARLSSTPAATDEPVKSSDSTSREQTTTTAAEQRRSSTASLSQSDETRRAFLVGQSEERVQALSVIMLHLCTGLQFAQGVATN